MDPSDSERAEPQAASIDWSNHPALEKSTSMIRDWDGYSWPKTMAKEGRWVEMAVLPSLVLASLDTLFACRPSEQQPSGVLTAMFNSLTPVQRGLPLDPRLAVAITSAGAIRNVDDDSDRSAVEAAIVAH